MGAPYAGAMPPAPWWRRPAVHDAVTTAVVVVTTTILVWDGRFAATRPRHRTLHWYVVVLVVVGGLPLLARRSRPVAAFVATTLAVALVAIIDVPIGLPVAPGVALFSVAASRVPGSRRVRPIGIVVGAYAAYGASCAVAIGSAPWSELSHTALLWTVCWLAGERARLQRAQLDELRRDAQRQRELAAVEERMRIARDLHDAAGHAVNVIAVQAAAARLRHGDDAPHLVEVLGTIEQLARETAAEVDEMVGVLRSPGDTSDVAPVSLQSLDPLVQGLRRAGFRLGCAVVGEPQALPPAVDQAAYRIVQEGLTNASRHGTGTAELGLDYRPGELVITVRNPVAASTPSTPGRTTGHGLVGLGERAILVGGSVSTAFD